MPTPSGALASAMNFEYGSILTGSAAAVSANGLDQQNPTFRGVKVAVDVTAITGTSPTLVVTLQGKDPGSGKYFTLLASASITATGTTVMTVYPGVAASANVSVSDVVPRTWRAISTVGGTGPAVTFTVGAVGIV